MSNNYTLVKQTNPIADLQVVKPTTFFDHRGENFEGFDSKYYRMMFSSIDAFRDNLTEPSKEFKVDSFSISNKNVLRGLHGDHKNWKLVQCLLGSIYLVVIDLREDSPTYKQQDTFYINEKNKLQVLIPPGCVNGHLCLSDSCLFSYKLTEDYVSIDDQISIKWNDPEYNIFWPISSPILSKRDT
jgi:dTDP-4-dehydrorhamnose 3,5-epimerase